MRRVLLALALIFLAFGAEAQQFYRSDAPSAIGGNLVGFNNIDFPFNNFFKSLNSESGPTGYPEVFDSDGYPNNPSGSGGIPLSGTIGGSILLPDNYCTTHWMVDWQGTLGASAQPGYIISPSGTPPRITVVSGSSFVSGSADDNMELYGTNGAVEFRFNDCSTGGINAPAGNNLSVGFLSGASYGTAVSGGSTLKNMRLYRCLTTYPNYNSLTPCTAATAALNANPSFGGFNPDFIASVSHARPAWLRFLAGFGVNTVLNTLTKYAYRPLPTQFSYSSGRWNPGSWAGEITCPTPSGGKCGSDAFSATIAGATLVDGFMVQGYLQAGTQTVVPTLALNGGTAYPLINQGGGAQANFTASISDGGGSCNGSSSYSGVAGTCMVVTAVANGTLLVNGPVFGQNVLPGTTIASQASGTTGSTGSYVVSQSLAVPSAAQEMGGLGTGFFVPIIILQQPTTLRCKRGSTRRKHL